MDEAPNTPSFRIERLPFDQGAVIERSSTDERFQNWPVVYVINNEREIYVGETSNARSRMIAHLKSSDRRRLKQLRIIVDDTFNKSVCLDLEAHLISLFSGDPKYAPQNIASGNQQANYFQRDEYRQSFTAITDELSREGVFSQSIPDIVNGNLFKYSPFKSLNTEQEIVIEGVLEKLVAEIDHDSDEPMVVEGAPGTGKTIVAIYLLKLLVDIATSDPDEAAETNSLFADYFQSGYREKFADLKIGIVIPQQSLRKTIEKVFRKTPGLNKSMVLGPFDVGRSTDQYDLLIVDETHRLGRRSNQSSAMLNRYFREINERLFGKDRDDITQLDWIRAQSRHQLYLLDTAQSVRPADLSPDETARLIETAREAGSLFPLVDQMRVNGGTEYVDYVGRILAGAQCDRPTFDNYDVRLFDDLGEMRQAIVAREAEVGLSRLIAGYAWEWKSKKNKTAPDIELDGLKLFWNRTATDWVNSPTAIEEVGSIHTVQGYELNYAGVIIGNDLRFDERTGKMVFSRADYFDQRGKENLTRLGRTFDDDEILEYVKNVYRVLLTRGIKGTYIYVCDPALRRHLAKFF